MSIVSGNKKSPQKKIVLRSSPPPAPYQADEPEFKFAREFLETGNLLESARRYIPYKSETGLGNFVASYKMQETLQFIAQLKRDGFIISDNQLDMINAAVYTHDPADAFEADGVTLKNIHAMPIRTRAAIASIETTKTLSGEITKIKFLDRLKAMDMAMKRRNMFEDNNKSKAPTIQLSID